MQMSVDKAAMLCKSLLAAMNSKDELKVMTPAKKRYLLQLLKAAYELSSTYQVMIRTCSPEVSRGLITVAPQPPPQFPGLQGRR